MQPAGLLCMLGTAGIIVAAVGTVRLITHAWHEAAPAKGRIPSFIQGYS